MSRLDYPIHMDIQSISQEDTQKLVAAIRQSPAVLTTSSGWSRNTLTKHALFPTSRATIAVVLK